MHVTEITSQLCLPGKKIFLISESACSKNEAQQAFPERPRNVNFQCPVNAVLDLEC